MHSSNNNSEAFAEYIIYLHIWIEIFENTYVEYV